MKGLKRQKDRTEVKAGEYRTILVSIGNHTYPPPEFVPGAMKKFVVDYNAKSSKQDHDSFHLALMGFNTSLWLFIQ